jgi:hypothetical protein
MIAGLDLPILWNGFAQLRIWNSPFEVLMDFNIKIQKIE